MATPIVGRIRPAAGGRDYGALLRNRLALSGALLVGVVVALALVGEIIAPFSAQQMQAERFSPPSWTHPMGTDQFGRDVLSRVMAGARASLLISATGVAGALLIGGTVALIVGYAGGFLDLLLT